MKNDDYDDEIKKLALDYTEKIYYKLDKGEEFNGEPLFVYSAFIEGYKHTKVDENCEYYYAEGLGT